MKSTLPFKAIQFRENMPHQKRVMFFDPTFVFENVKKFDAYRRHQNISVYDIFPQIEKDKCACGCGVKLTGRQKRWASDCCSRYALAVREILYGTLPTIQRYMRLYYGWNCFECGCEDKGKKHGSYEISDFQIDHIIPVKLGGGACWLSNYQILCTACHVRKTNKDFGHGKENKPQQPSLFK